MILGFVSCTTETTENEQQVIEMSGTLSMDELPYTIHIDGKEFTIEAEDINSKFSAVSTRSMQEYGPYYSGSNMLQLANNERYGLNYSTYIGIYFCDLFRFTNDIQLPSNAIMGRIEVPNPAGFSSIVSPQERGIIWILSLQVVVLCCVLHSIL